MTQQGLKEMYKIILAFISRPESGFCLILIHIFVN